MGGGRSSTYARVCHVGLELVLEYLALSSIEKLRINFPKFFLSLFLRSNELRET